MKKTIFICLLLACVSCVSNPSKNSKQEDASKEFIKVFKEYGFSITSPCVLEDEKSHGLGNDAYFAGTELSDDPENAIGYQVVVKEVPKGFKDLSEVELNAMMDQMKNSGFVNVEKVLFSDNKYPGFIGDKNQDGSVHRGVMFNKDKYIISLIVSADSSVLDQKFNDFTNSFTVID